MSEMKFPENAAIWINELKSLQEQKILEIKNSTMDMHSYGIIWMPESVASTYPNVSLYSKNFLIEVDNNVPGSYTFKVGHINGASDTIGGAARDKAGNYIIIEEDTVWQTTTYTPAAGIETTDPYAQPLYQVSGNRSIPPVFQDDLEYVFIEYLQVVVPEDENIVTTRDPLPLNYYSKFKDGYKITIQPSATPPSSNAILIGTVDMVAVSSVTINDLRTYLKQRGETVEAYVPATSTITYSSAQNHTVAEHLAALGTGTMSNKNPHAQTVDDLGFDLGSLALQKNILINGSFDIWQRNTTFTGVTGGETPWLGYTADRWRTSINSGNCNVARILDVDGHNYFLRCDTTNVSTTNTNYIAQNVENYWQYIGKTITLSIRVRCSVATTIRAYINDYTSAYYFSPAYNTSQLNTWQTLTVTHTVTDSPAATLLQVGITFNLISLAGLIDVDDAMLVLGSQPAEFIPISPAEELELCQRYFYKTYALGTPVGGTGAPPTYPGQIVHYVDQLGNFARVSYISWQFPTRMRTIPTIHCYSSITDSGALPPNGNIAATGGDITASVATVGDTSAQVGGTDNPSTTVNLQFQATADAEIY